MSRGFFGIGIWHYKYDCNAGTLFRSAYAFGANFIYTIGRRYKGEASDTCNSAKHIPYFHYDTLEAFKEYGPKDCRLTVVELDDKAHDLPNFVHFERSAYLLGSEGGGLPPSLIKDNVVVKIPGCVCLNVATAGSIVLYDRIAKTK